MSDYDYTTYYVQQAGTGISGFSGVKYQRGHGFFGRIFSNTILPMLKYLGKKALNTGVNIGGDLLQGENFKTSAKRRLKSTGFDLAEDAIDKIRNYKQKGTGRKKQKSNSNIRRSQKRKPSLLQLKALAKGRKTLQQKRKINNRRKKSSFKTLF